VAGFAEMLHRSIGATIRIQMDLKTDDEYVLGDQIQLEMGMLNLALNARDAMPDGGDITIATRLRQIAGDRELPDGRYVELSIADKGIGMPQKSWRVSSSRSSRPRRSVEAPDWA